MINFLLKRVAYAFLILIGITFITFILTYIIPADPVRMLAGRSATPETVESIRQQLGLDRPLIIQYLNYLYNLLQGDLGRSYVQKTQVTELIMSRLPATLLLMVGAIFFELLIGLTVGIIASVKRGTNLDKILTTISFVGISAPQFVVGLILLYLFAYKLDFLPLGGYGTISHLILPALTLGITGGGWYGRMTRSSMIDVLRQDYIRTAKAKGASNSRIVLIHALRNAILPIIAMIGLDIGIFMSGAVVVESVFGWPGIGQLAWQAIQRLDIPIIVGVTIVAATFIILGNLIADIASAISDPKIRIH
jgi:peptide/nickel transport system permease protein|tara:strand:+ start:249 stop:1169 length:921 start_codon:yes stop_codon:yes gene_type:complete